MFQAVLTAADLEQADVLEEIAAVEDAVAINQNKIVYYTPQTSIRND